MKKILIAVLLALNTLCLSGAYAISCSDSLGVTFPPAQRAKLCAYFLNTASLTGSLTFAGVGPIIAPTALSFAVGAASTPNYTLDNVKLLFPNAGIMAAPTSVAISAGAANTPNYTFDAVKLTFPSTGVLAASTAIGVAAGAATTPNVTFQSNGIALTNTNDLIYPAAAVITPSTGVPTPAAGNTLTNRYTILAAGAPTAAFVVLPVATTSVGRSWTVYNQGSNPLAIVPQTGVINVSAALTPFSCTTLKECKCTGIATGTFGCSQQ